MSERENAAGPALAPCPFCGGQPNVIDGMAFTMIVCQCGASQDTLVGRDRAIALWNTRATPAQSEELAALREDAARYRWIVEHASYVNVNFLRDGDGVKGAQIFCKHDVAADKHVEEGLSSVIDRARAALAKVPR